MCWWSILFLSELPGWLMNDELVRILCRILSTRESRWCYEFESDLFGLVHLYFRSDYLPFKFDNSENPPPEDQVEDPIVEEASEPEILPPPPTFDFFPHSNA